MGWRSVLISQPGYLKLKDQALSVEQQSEKQFTGMKILLGTPKKQEKTVGAQQLILL